MSLASGQSYLAIPGPSVIPEQVLQSMHRSSPNIYEGELVDLTRSLVPDLKAVARTDGHVAMYIGNGHAAWEAAVANVLAPGELVLVASTGRFAHGWGETATGQGVVVELMEFGIKSPVDPQRIADRLRADSERKIKAIMVVHVDTSSSIRSEIAPIREVLDDLEHPALLMVDCIASLGCDPFEMDAWGADIMVAGCQKGLMVPAGMSFVYFNDRAAQVRSRMERVSWYWDWVKRTEPDYLFQYFGGTAPTHHLYGLRTALDMIHSEGIEATWARHAKLAEAVWTAVEHWSQKGPLTLNVADRAHRSHAVTALRIGQPYGVDLRHWCEQQAGLTLGIGLGMSEPEDPTGLGFFRFGHMGHVNAQMIMALLGTVEAGLAAIGAPYQAGGVSAAAQVIARA